MIRVDTGYKERTGKDYIQCWVNDSLVFNGLYVNKTDDQILDYHEDWLGMEITRFDKSGYDSLKNKDTCHISGYCIISWKKGHKIVRSDTG